MKKQIRRMVAAAAATATFIGCIMPSAAAAEEGVLKTGEIAYDQLIEMADKSILVKDCDTKMEFTVISKDGSVTDFDSSSGIDEICPYTSFNIGIEKFMAPYYFMSPFNYSDPTYRLSHEKGVMIVRTGNKYAIADETGKIVSDKFSALHRINDKYFVIDESGEGVKGTDTYKEGSAYVLFNKNKCGLLSADGTVIVQPEDGICGFFPCGNYFVVWTTDGFYVIDSTGKKLGKTYEYAYPMNMDGSYFEHLLTRGSPFGYSNDLNRAMYDFSSAENGCMIFKQSGKYTVFSPFSGKFSDEYTRVRAVESKKYGHVYLLSDIYSGIVCDEEFNKIAENEDVNMDVVGEPDERRIEFYHYKTKDIYDTDMNLVKTEDYNATKIYLKSCTVALEDDKFIARSYDGKKENDITSFFVPEGAKIRSASISYAGDGDKDYDYDYLFADTNSIAAYRVTYSPEGEDNRQILATERVFVDTGLNAHKMYKYAHVMDLGGDKFLMRKEDYAQDMLVVYDAKTDETTTTELLKNYTDFLWLNDESESDPIFVLSNDKNGIFCDAEFKPIFDEIKGYQDAFSIYGDCYCVMTNADNDLSQNIFSTSKGMVVEKCIGYYQVGRHILASDGEHLKVYDLEKDEPYIREFESAPDVRFSKDIYDDPTGVIVTISKYVDNGTKTIVYDLDNNKVLYEQNCKYSNMSPFVGGYSGAVKASEPNTLYLVDLDGEIAFKHTWEDAKYIEAIETTDEGVMVRVVIDDNTNYGVYIRYSDINNKICSGSDEIQIARQYGDLFSIIKNDRAGIIDADGNEIVPAAYRRILTYDTFNGEDIDFTNDDIYDALVKEHTSLVKDFGSLGGLVFVQNADGNIGVFKIGDAGAKRGSLGDVNGDGAVDSVDASLVLAEYALVSTGGKGEFSEAQKKVADIDKNGSIDSVDASSILQYYSYTSTGGKIGDMAEWLKTVQ